MMAGEVLLPLQHQVTIGEVDNDLELHSVASYIVLALLYDRHHSACVTITMDDP